MVIVPYVTHRNPEFWDNPLAFDPAHFSEAQVAARPRYAFYPFGAGQRICIGNHFAMLEAVLLLAARNNGDVRFAGVVRPSSPIEMTAVARG